MASPAETIALARVNRGKFVLACETDPIYRPRVNQIGQRVKGRLYAAQESHEIWDIRQITNEHGKVQLWISYEGSRMVSKRKAEENALGLLKHLMNDSKDVVLDAERMPETRIYAQNVLKNILSWEAGTGVLGPVLLPKIAAEWKIEVMAGEDILTEPVKLTADNLRSMPVDTVIRTVVDDGYDPEYGPMHYVFTYSGNDVWWCTGDDSSWTSQQIDGYVSTNHGEVVLLWTPTA